MMNEYGHINADIVIREDIDEDQLIDYLAGNRLYLPAIVAINKTDLVNKEYIATAEARLLDWTVIPISAEIEPGPRRRSRTPCTRR